MCILILILRRRQNIFLQNMMNIIISQIFLQKLILRGIF